MAAEQGFACVCFSRALLMGFGLDGLMPGLAEEITAAVSRFRWISCVAEAPDEHGLNRPGMTLDSDYILDSMLQRAGDRTRIIIRLFDLHAGSNVVWARRFDRKASDDPLTLQAEIASETASQVDLELLLREGERRNTGETAEVNRIRSNAACGSRHLSA